VIRPVEKEELIILVSGSATAAIDNLVIEEFNVNYVDCGTIVVVIIVDLRLDR